MEDDELDELERLFAKTTPGPYEIERYDRDTGYIRYQVESPLEGAIVAAMEDDESPRAKQDAEFFIAAHAALPALIAEVREMYAHAANMAKLLGEARQAHDEVLTERDALRAEVERMRPVVEAAIKWHHEDDWPRPVIALQEAVDAYKKGTP